MSYRLFLPIHHRIHNAGVGGSSPPVATNNIKGLDSI